MSISYAYFPKFRNFYHSVYTLYFSKAGRSSSDSLKKSKVITPLSAFSMVFWLYLKII